MQLVQTHSRANNQGQQFVMNSHVALMPPPVHSVLFLSVLSHAYALGLTAPLLFFLSLGGLSLYFGLSVASQKAESLQLVGTPAPWGCHSGSCTAPSSIFLHFLPLPPLLFSRYICHANNRGQCTNLPRATTSLGTAGFLPEEGYFGVLKYVLQGPPTYKGNPKS